MMQMLARATFVLALIAAVSTSFVAPAHAGKRLLEVRNKTEYVLHFTYQLGSTSPKTEVAVMPNGTWGLEQAGMYTFHGVLKKTGSPDIPLQTHGILLKENQGVMMVLIAVYDHVGSKSYRWYTFNA
jgi:hypothetical protein